MELYLQKLYRALPVRLRLEGGGAGETIKYSDSASQAKLHLFYFIQNLREPGAPVYLQFSPEGHHYHAEEGEGGGGREDEEKKEREEEEERGQRRRGQGEGRRQPSHIPGQHRLAVVSARL